MRGACPQPTTLFCFNANCLFLCCGFVGHRQTVFSMVSNRTNTISVHIFCTTLNVEHYVIRISNGGVERRRWVTPPISCTARDVMQSKSSAALSSRFFLISCSTFNQWHLSSYIVLLLLRNYHHGGTKPHCKENMELLNICLCKIFKKP